MKEKKEKLTMRNLANQLEALEKKLNIVAAALVGTWIGSLAYYLLAT